MPARLVMPKATKRGLRRALLAEEGRIGRIGAGIAAFDIVKAELVQHAGNRNLVLDGEVDAGRLLPVAERRVEEVDLFACHDGGPVGLVARYCFPANLSVARISRSRMPGSE